MILRLLVLLIVFQSSYYTGQKVFSSRFPSEVFDYSRDTWIRIINSETDIIVAVENVNSGKVIRHAYINGGDVYTFKAIPVGTYVCKYMWTGRDGRRHYEKDNQTMTYKSNEIGGYEITLTETTYGNLSQSTISEDDFFN